MQTLNIYYKAFSILFFLTASVVVSQNRYLSTDTQVTIKMLDESTIYSNISLTENLSQIASFSYLNTIYDVIDFENMIKNEEMVTVFAPQNVALSHLSEEERQDFLSVSNREFLKEIISYYIIPGRVDEHAIRRAVNDGNGTASFRTIDGKNIRFTAEGETIYLYAANGSRSKLKETNFRHSKGFMHVTDGLALPEAE